MINNEWTDVVNDINTELRRPDKLIIQSGALNKVIVSDNWIIKVGQWPWKFNLAHKWSEIERDRESCKPVQN